MNPFHALAPHAEEFTKVAAAGLLLWAARKPLIAMISKLRNVVCRNRIEFERKVFEFHREMREEVVPSAQRNTEMIQQVHYAVFNGGHGIQAQVARLTAHHVSNFEGLRYPAFECNQDGDNITTNAAYRKLVGATRESSLNGGMWHSVVYGELRDSYEDAFVEASAAKEDFIHDIDIRNPMTGEHRGRWKVHATAAVIGDGLIYSGRFIMAVDQVAVAIADQERWDIRFPEGK